MNEDRRMLIDDFHSSPSPIASQEMAIIDLRWDGIVLAYVLRHRRPPESGDK
jgi:hypothetical protein